MTWEFLSDLAVAVCDDCHPRLQPRFPWWLLRQQKVCVVHSWSRQAIVLSHFLSCTDSEDFGLNCSWWTKCISSHGMKDPLFEVTARMTLGFLSNTRLTEYKIQDEPSGNIYFINHIYLLTPYRERFLRPTKMAGNLIPLCLARHELHFSWFLAD